MNDAIQQKIIKRFNSLEPFESEEDIPDIPKTTKDIYDNVIVPNLIRCGAIPKNQLEVNQEYAGLCRNSYKARWTGEKFIYTRYKFGTSYEEEINHFQDDDGFDLFVPIKKID